MRSFIRLDQGFVFSPPRLPEDNVPETDEGIEPIPPDDILDSPEVGEENDEVDDFDADYDADAEESDDSEVDPENEFEDNGEPDAA